MDLTFISRLNATTGDYLITTSSAPPGGYVMQALLGYGHSSGVTSTQQNLAYDYDAVGNLKNIYDNVWTGRRSFVYDDLNRLTQATGNFGVNQALVTQDYTYDAIGNILSKAGITYCYGYMAGCTDSNRLSGVKTTSDGGTYTYDANGNIASGAGRTYVWNSDNRLDQVTGPGGSAVMTYDYTGIRIKKTGSSGTTYFPFTGYEVQGGTVTKYVRIGNEIIASKQGATKRFYHNDHLGGVNIISDINGNQVQLTEYDPWGKVSRSDASVDLTHRFTGQELDSESDVYYYGGRYYSQGLGRFISPDPFVQDPDDPQNLNRYAYVLNSPQNYIDPSGYFFDDYESYDSGWGSSGWVTASLTKEASSSSAGSVLSTTGWSGSTSWQDLGSSALAGIQAGASISAAYWGATALGGLAAAGGCAAALPLCIGAGVAFVGGVYGASDTISSVVNGTYQNFASEIAKSYGASPPLAMAIGAGVEMLGLPEGIATRNPFKIRFSQDSIGLGFKNKAFGTINDLAEGLRSGKINPLDIEPVRLVEREGCLICIDNRRLEAFRRAGVEIPARMATQAEIQQAIRRNKFSAGKLGSDTIKVRGE